MIIYQSAERIWKKEDRDQCDFVYVTGDAYVDHPSFGHAIISRVLESHGYRVGDHPAAGLENSGEHPDFGRAQACLSHLSRKHGFHRQPLLCL